MVRGNNGFTLLEAVIVISIVAILSAILIPSIEKLINSTKISHAQNETEVIALGIVSFFKDTGRWPVARARDGKNRIYLLHSPGNVPSYNPSVRSSRRWKASGAGAWRRNRVDEFHNHLIENNPQGRNRWKYPESGELAWKGPYLQDVNPDPWGNHYSCNVRGLWESRWSDAAVWVWSAGPDGEADTPIKQVRSSASLQDDDIGTRIK